MAKRQSCSRDCIYHICSVFVLSFLLFPLAARAEISDPFDASDNLVAELNSQIAVKDSKAVITRTAGEDCVVDWHRAQPLELNKSNDRIEIAPAGPVGRGAYSIWILFFDRNGKFMAEKQWLEKTSDTSLQVLPSVARFAADNDIRNAAKFWLRFRILGTAGEGFMFDGMNIKKQDAAAEDARVSAKP
jgi:hypothetical protein